MRLHLNDPVSYVQHDVLFHRQIALAAGNGVFVWLLGLLSKVLADAWLMRAKEGHSERTFAEHQAIAEAIEAHDPERAREAMLRHLMLSKFYSNWRTPVELRVIIKDEADTG